MTPKQFRDTCKDFRITNKQIANCMRAIKKNPRWSIAKVDRIYPAIREGIETLIVVHYNHDCFESMDLFEMNMN